MNRVILIGTVEQVPTYYEKKSDTSTSSCIIKLKTTKPAATLANGKEIPEKVLYHRVLAFGQKADTLRTLQPHTLLAVEGELSYQSRTDDFGNVTSSTDIFVQSFDILAVLA